MTEQKEATSDRPGVAVGLFIDMRNPDPWRRDPTALYARTLDLCAEADRRGIGAFWFTKHHFTDDDYLPQPLTLAAAVAARTRHARLGTAVVLGALRDPIHTAEQAALVDVISGGRLELGIGAGYARGEFTRFAADFRGRRAACEDHLVTVRRLFAERAVTPSPVQDEVPMWLGYQGPVGARQAGRMGVSLLSLRRSLLEPLRAGREEAGLDPAGAAMGGVVDIVVSDDPERDAPLIAPHYAYQQESYRALHHSGASRDTNRRPAGEAPAVVRTVTGGNGLAVLTPDDAVTALTAAIGGLPARHVYVWLSVAGMPDALVERHVELVCDRVVPRLSGSPSPPTDAAAQPHGAR
ncbi:MAG TPA: LLM class flavin-dependent oxidoreductase [Ilumatobacter sp.]|nr:LLM class flavin-dependent oxidoreductase [Ilumatobacter sp.]